MTGSSRRRRTSLIAMVVATVVAGVLLAGGPTIANPLQSDDIEITVEFPRTVGLYPQSRVLVEGIRAGQVKDVKPLVDRVRATIAVNDVSLAPNATATLRLRSLIGERYVELGPTWSGKGPRLEDGARIPLERTRIPAEVSELFDESGRVAAELDADAMGRVVAEMAKAFGSRKDEVGALTAGLADVGRVLSARASELDSSLASLNGIVSTMAQRDNEIVRILRSSSAVSQALLAQEGALDGAITGLDDLLGTLADFTVKEKDKLLEATDRLGRIGRILAEHEAGWQRVVDLGPLYGYGWARAIHHDGEHWYLLEQSQGLMYVPYHPFFRQLNDRGGPGNDQDDHTFLPHVDYSCSPLRAAIPWTVDVTGPTGPGPLLPEQDIGDGFVRTNNEKDQAYSSPGYEGAEREPPPPPPDGGECDAEEKQVKVGEQ